MVALAWMFGTTLCFTLVNVIVHHVGNTMPPAQSAFIRFLWGVVFFAPALWRLLRLGFTPQVWALFGLRGVFHSCAVILWFYAMTRIPIADVTAIGYLNPIVVTVGGALLFGEGLAWRRIVAVGLALVGALIILRPGLREIDPGHLAQLGAAIFFGAAYLAAKRLTSFVTATTVVAMMTLVVTIVLAPVALWVWVPVGVVDVAWMGAVAVVATTGHYAMTRAFEAAPVTVSQPAVFLQLIWASLAGWLLFAEPVDPYVIVGGAVIIGAISYMTWREAQLKRRVTPVANQTKL
ncbi:DMT family transporter [Thioclava sp. SK-1]|uniref:DMT family transporter n=1 Tax=Thioclava sp. SK-1 TaxID=1889770 RepID=UPI002100F6E3|nr:DMT family transporter [Thioclava sp. SK-1]